jgi:hypothetical protein
MVRGKIPARGLVVVIVTQVVECAVGIAVIFRAMPTASVICVGYFTFGTGYMATNPLFSIMSKG